MPSLTSESGRALSGWWHCDAQGHHRCHSIRKCPPTRSLTGRALTIHKKRLRPNDPDGLAPAALTGEEGVKTHPIGRGACLNAAKRARCLN